MENVNTNLSSNLNPLPNQPVESKKLTAGLLALFFGSLGIHKFVLGYVAAGIVHIIATILTCGAFSLVSFIEGIIYLSKSDEEFIQTYQLRKREWF